MAGVILLAMGAAIGWTCAAVIAVLMGERRRETHMHYSRRTWCCPFYKYDEKFAVHCEGGSVYKLRDREIFSDHADHYCGNAKGWRQCPTAVSLERLYDKKSKCEDWT